MIDSWIYVLSIYISVTIAEIPTCSTMVDVVTI